VKLRGGTPSHAPSWKNSAEAVRGVGGGPYNVANPPWAPLGKKKAGFIKNTGSGPASYGGCVMATVGRYAPRSFRGRKKGGEIGGRKPLPQPESNLITSKGETRGAEERIAGYVQGGGVLE